jgi:hypothetical protein
MGWNCNRQNRARQFFPEFRFYGEILAKVVGGCGKIERSLIYFNIFNGFECDTLVMVVPETITKLIERFDFHRQSHISSRDVYNETKLRQDYLDHVFIALGYVGDSFYPHI